MRKQSKRRWMLGTGLLLAGVLLAACGKPSSEMAVSDPERYIYYEKEDALWRADVKDPSAPILEKMVANLDEEASELVSESNYTAMLSKNGQYAAIQVNEKTETGTYTRLYVMKNQPEAKPELIADRVNWAEMDGNTLVFNKENYDINNSPYAVWCYRPEEGVWQLAMQGADYGTTLLKDDKMLFSTYDWGDYYGEGDGETVYFADISAKKNSQPKFLFNHAGYEIDAADDLSKIYYVKQGAEEEAGLGLYVLEDLETERCLLEYSEGDVVLALNRDTESFYLRKAAEDETESEKGTESDENTDSELTSLYYCSNGEMELLSEIVGAGSGDYLELGPGLLRYTEKVITRDGVKDRVYLAKDGQTTELEGISYLTFGDPERKGWTEPTDEVYDDEQGTYFAVCVSEKTAPESETDEDFVEKPESEADSDAEEETETEEDDPWGFLGELFGSWSEPQTEYRLVQISLDEDSFGEMKLIDASEYDMEIDGIRGDQVYYHRLSDQSSVLEFWCNGKLLAEDFKAFSLKQNSYFMTTYPEQSYEHLEYTYDDTAALWSMDEAGKVRKLCEDTAFAEFRNDFAVLLTGYENPEMQGKLMVLKDGTPYEIDSEVKKFYLFDSERALSASDYYLLKDEADEDGEEEEVWDWETENSGNSMDWGTDDAMTGLEDLFKMQMDDMTEEEIAAAKENGTYYLENRIYHSPNDLYTLNLGAERAWGIQNFAYGSGGAIYIQDTDNAGNMAINLRELPEPMDLTKDASEYPDIEDQLTMFMENELISCENIIMDDTPALRVRFTTVEFGLDGHYISYLVNDKANTTHCISITYMEEDNELEQDMTEIVESFRWSAVESGLI